MSQKPRKKHPPSTKRLTLSQRLRRSWTLSRVRRTTKRLKKEQKRLLLMRVQMDYQLLRVKQLEETMLLLEAQHQEMVNSHHFRMTGEVSPSETKAHLDSLLGLTQQP